MKSSEIIQIGLEICRDILKRAEDMVNGKVEGQRTCGKNTCDKCGWEYQAEERGDIDFCKWMAIGAIGEKLPETDRQKVIAGFDKADKMELSLNLKKIRRRLSYDEKKKLKKLKKDCIVFESVILHMGFDDFVQSRHLDSLILCDTARNIEEDDGEDDEYSAWLHNWEKAIEEAIEEGEEDKQ